MSKEHPALPPPHSRPWLTVALAAWVLAAVAGGDHGPPLERGEASGTAVLMTEVREGRHGPWFLAQTELGTLLFEIETDPGLSLGDRVAFEGVVGGEPGMAGGRPYRAVLETQEMIMVEPSASIPMRIGGAMRSAVMERLAPFDDGRALLAGFLIGDTRHLDPLDAEAMRRSGLSHFVAVSGSNVALFLGLLALAAGPLAMGPRRRAALGLASLPIYAAATGFEPSVMRASAMAALALGGRLVGIVFEAWQLLSAAVTLLIIQDPWLVSNVGFQLSVAATCGVLVGSRWPVGPGRARRALAVTIGAQLAVAPLLLAHFGSVPLFSPIANLVAAPIVAASTVVGAVGVAGLAPLTGIAALLADFVLILARGAAWWPQVGPLGLGVLIGSVVLAGNIRALRPLLAVGLAILVTTTVLLGDRARLPDPGVVVFDVGQGDAILLHGGQGRFALVDGGPDPIILAERLGTYGVRALDLVVLTHVHADHAVGLGGIVGRIAIGQVWMSTVPHETEASRLLVEKLQDENVPVSSPSVGEQARLGSLDLSVAGPLRRYASPNDQSIVLMVEGPGRSMLLSGDIETVAQSELGGLRADVLKVPHQGAATSDPRWLEGVGASLAVISVGPNDFGHPSPEVIEVLEATGAHVVRTDLAGDVVVPLG